MQIFTVIHHSSVWYKKLNISQEQSHMIPQELVPKSWINSTWVTLMRVPRHKWSRLKLASFNHISLHLTNGAK